jgi:hypothetical protein
MLTPEMLRPRLRRSWSVLIASLVIAFGAAVPSFVFVHATRDKTHAIVGVSDPTNVQDAVTMRSIGTVTNAAVSGTSGRIVINGDGTSWSPLYVDHGQVQLAPRSEGDCFLEVGATDRGGFIVPITTMTAVDRGPVPRSAHCHVWFAVASLPRLRCIFNYENSTAGPLADVEPTGFYFDTAPGRRIVYNCFDP